MFYRYEHYMSISHKALIVAIVQTVPSLFPHNTHFQFYSVLSIIYHYMIYYILYDYILLSLFTHQSFSHQRQQMTFHWRLSASKSPQVSRTFLSILVVFNNTVVWMVFSQPPTSKSSRPFNNPLVTMPKVPITIGIIITFMFHSFFQFSSNVEVLISLFSFFQFYSVVSQDSKVDNFAKFLFFFVVDYYKVWSFGRDQVIRCMSKSIGVCVCHFLGHVLSCAYTVCGMVKFNFLHISQWITLPTHSCLALYSFCANLLHSHIM